MKILFLNDFIPPHNIGGPGFRNFEVARELRKRGNDVYFITSCQDREQEVEATRDGIKIFNVYSKYPLKYRHYVSVYNFKILGKIKKIIMELKPDITHVDTVHTHLSYASVKIAKKYSKAVFLTSRDSMIFHYGKFFPKDKKCGEINYKTGWIKDLKIAKKRYNPFRNIMIKHYLKYADKIFAISNDMARALKQNGISNVEVLYNGIPVPEPEPSYIENNSKIIFFPGRTSYAKGVYVLLDAFLLIKKDVPDAKVLIVGATKESKEEIARCMKGTGVGENDIEIIGWLSNEEVHKIYDKIGVVATPSICADFLLGVNLEAAAHKRPVVTTCFGGAKEFVLDGETGYVVNPYDLKELAEKISDLLINKEKARQFSEASFKRLKEKFSIGVHVDKLLKFYREFV